MIPPLEMLLDDLDSMEDDHIRYLSSKIRKECVKQDEAYATIIKDLVYGSFWKRWKARRFLKRVGRILKENH